MREVWFGGREVRRSRSERIGRELGKDMEVTKNRCMRESAVSRAKVERLMNNFTITVSVIWKYFHRSDILQQGRKCHRACRLLICL